jgi:cell division protein FtsN
MSKAEGEYELVLGNRQLLSAFFIIVILFGVFFTMGYVVGRNSAPAAAASPMPVPVATSQRPDAASSPPVQSAPPPAAAPTETPTTAPVQETKPAKQPDTVETKPVAPPAGRQAPRKIETQVEVSTFPPRASARPASASGAVAVNPGPGNMYLQVAAAAQPQAGVVVDTLKQKGFPALLAQGPNATLFRVMVGPFADASTLGKAKADLENAGFKPIVRK